MKSRRKAREYHEGPEAADRFQRGLSNVLSVTKEELTKREANYDETRRNKARRGPKPTK
jgi:hypothetical protein